MNAPDDPEPRFLDNLRAELTGWRTWFERAVVLAYAAAAGLFVVGFTMLTDQAIKGFDTMHAYSPWLTFLWTPACTAGVAWVTRRWFAGAAGSGIPQVMAALDPATPQDQRSRFVSLRLTFAKIGLAAVGLLAGLSIGREGPSVQVAAGVMDHARRWLGPRSHINERSLLVAGGAAGIAAAFNTPLAGVVFAIEELSQKLEQRSSGLILSAIVLSGLIAVSAFGNLTYFGVIRVPSLGWSLLGPGLVVVIIAGLLGGLFAKLLVASLAGMPDRVSRFRSRYPIRFAACCGFAVSFIGLVSNGSTSGSGYQYTKGMLEGDPSVPPMYVLLKFVTTWISAWSGVPGGIFAPALSIGAGVGHDIAMLTDPTSAAPLIAMGMAAFLAAVTQAPLTSFIIVMEMVDGHAMVLSLMTASMLASLIARTLTRPLYSRLAAMQMKRLDHVEASAEPASEVAVDAQDRRPPEAPHPFEASPVEDDDDTAQPSSQPVIDEVPHDTLPASRTMPNPATTRFDVRYLMSAQLSTLDVLPILQEVFGYPAFRGQQQAVIEHVSAGGDALVLMPTGGGKSLCYQVPAIARHRSGHGVAVVVSPLIALMHDQVGALEEAGVHASFLNSTLSLEEAQRIEREMMSGRLVLLYAAPERINTPRVLAQLDSLNERGLLSLFAIDEAHCVSQWGHDFRAEYLSLNVLHERYPSVPRVALTATADTLTRADIISRLQLEDARVFISSFDRPNIRYTIVEKDNAKAQLLRFLQDEHEGDAGIVYCQSRKKVEETAAWLTSEGIAALPYHAGLDAGVRKRHQDRFLREEGLVMVATVAFGMGIDKPDVRFVCHLDLPKNIESYYQETGRAGRDGLAADAWMTYGLADVVNQRRMIDESPAGEEFKHGQRGKLDALLALAEAHDCRRARLLNYFGEGSQSCMAPQNLCDNCQSPPATWDATQASRKALSCIYRFHQAGGRRFGAGHLIDVLRGKVTEKVTQFGHESLSTFGIGADVSEAQWRTVLRQLIALGHVQSEGEFHTLELTSSARDVLRGDVPLLLRQTVATPKGARGRAGARATGSAGTSGTRDKRPPIELDPQGLDRFAALKAWRSEVAREHNLPAYIVFHDAALAEMARVSPTSLDELGSIAGVGSKKLDAYGSEILRVLSAH